MGLGQTPPPQFGNFPHIIPFFFWQRPLYFIFLSVFGFEVISIMRENRFTFEHFGKQYYSDNIKGDSTKMIIICVISPHFHFLSLVELKGGKDDNWLYHLLSFCQVYHMLRFWQSTMIKNISTFLSLYHIGWFERSAKMIINCMAALGQRYYTSQGEIEG